MGEGHFLLGIQDTLTIQICKRDSLHIVKIKSLTNDTVSQDTLIKTKYPYGIPRGLFLRSIEL